MHIFTFYFSSNGLFTLFQLTKERMSTDIPAAHPYIAARFESQSLPPEFYLGNNQEYGSFSNRPLNVNDGYRVFLRAYSVDQVRQAENSLDL